MTELDVLLVDDEEELVSALVERLEIRGLAAAGARTGAEALARLAETHARVVVADVKMPGMSGIELTRRIRAEHPGTAVVLLTGHGSEADARAGMEVGAAAYLAKPVNIEDLLRVMREATEGAR